VTPTAQERASHAGLSHAFLILSVDVQDIQPLRVIHLGGDEIPRSPHKQSTVCRQLLDQSPHISLSHHFMRLAVDTAARLGVDAVQVRVDKSYENCVAKPSV